MIKKFYKKKEIICNIINDFTVTFDQLIAEYLMNKNIFFKKNNSDLKLLNGRVFYM